MGLDINFYKHNKNNKIDIPDFLDIETTQLYEKDDSKYVFRIEDDYNQKAIEELIPYGKIVTITDKYYNEAKYILTLNLPELKGYTLEDFKKHALIRECHFNKGNLMTYVYFLNKTPEEIENKTSITVDIHLDENDPTYWEEYQCKALIMPKMQDVAYFRKHWELLHALEDVIHKEIPNVYFIKVTPNDIRKALKRIDWNHESECYGYTEEGCIEELYDILNDTNDDNVYFIHPWW